MTPEHEQFFNEGYNLGLEHGHSRADVTATSKLALIVADLMVEGDYPSARAVNTTLLALYGRMVDELQKSLKYI